MWGGTAVFFGTSSDKGAAKPAAKPVSDKKEKKATKVAPKHTESKTMRNSLIPSYVDRMHQGGRFRVYENDGKVVRTVMCFFKGLPEDCPSTLLTEADCEKYLRERYGPSGSLFYNEAFSADEFEENSARQIFLHSLVELKLGHAGPTAQLKDKPADCLFTLWLPNKGPVLGFEALNAKQAERWSNSIYRLMRLQLFQNTAKVTLHPKEKKASAGAAADPSAAHRRMGSSLNPAEIFTFISKLGEGSYGTVYKAMDSRDNKLVAVKVMPATNDTSQSLRKEIGVLEKCNSEFIVGYKGTFNRDNHVWIVMEYCGAGSLNDIMEECDSTFSEVQIAAIMKMAIQGLVYLHGAGKIHRDIKAGNILATADGMCKLADFGVAAELVQTLAKKRTVIGTPHWMAPEVLASDDDYNEKADIWSMGITAYELALGEPPHGNLHPMRVVVKIPTSPPPTLPEEHYWTEGFQSFLATCLQKDPAKRPSAADLLKHPFIAKARGQDILMDMVKQSADAILAKEENLDADGKEIDPRNGTIFGTMNNVGASSGSKSGTRGKMKPTAGKPTKRTRRKPSMLGGGKTGATIAKAVVGGTSALIGDTQSFMGTIMISPKSKAPPVEDSAGHGAAGPMGTMIAVSSSPAASGSPASSTPAAAAGSTTSSSSGGPSAAATPARGDTFSPEDLGNNYGGTIVQSPQHLQQQQQQGGGAAAAAAAAAAGSPGQHAQARPAHVAGYTDTLGASIAAITGGTVPRAAALIQPRSRRTRRFTRHRRVHSTDSAGGSSDAKEEEDEDSEGGGGGGGVGSGSDNDTDVEIDDDDDGGGGSDDEDTTGRRAVSFATASDGSSGGGGSAPLKPLQTTRMRSGGDSLISAPGAPAAAGAPPSAAAAAASARAPVRSAMRTSRFAAGGTMIATGAGGEDVDQEPVFHEEAADFNIQQTAVQLSKVSLASPKAGAAGAAGAASSPAAAGSPSSALPASKSPHGVVTFHIGQ